MLELSKEYYNRLIMHNGLEELVESAYTYSSFTGKLAQVLEPYQLKGTSSYDVVEKTLLTLIGIQNAPIRCQFGESTKKGFAYFLFQMPTDGSSSSILPAINKHFPSLAAEDAKDWIPPQEAVGIFAENKDRRELLHELPIYLGEDDGLAHEESKNLKAMSEKLLAKSQNSIIIVLLKLEGLCKDYLPQLEAYLKNHSDLVDKAQPAPLRDLNSLSANFSKRGIDLKSETSLLGDLTWGIIQEYALKKTMVLYAMSLGLIKWRYLQAQLQDSILDDYRSYDDVHAPIFHQLIAQQLTPTPTPWGKVNPYGQPWKFGNSPQFSSSPQPKAWSFFPLEAEADLDAATYAHLFVHLPLIQATAIATFFNQIAPQSAVALTREQYQPAEDAAVKPHNEEEKQQAPQDEVSIIRVEKRTLNDPRFLALLNAQFKVLSQDEKDSYREKNERFISAGILSNELKIMHNLINQDDKFSHDPLVKKVLKAINALTGSLDTTGLDDNPLVFSLKEELLHSMNECSQKFHATPKRAFCFFACNAREELVQNQWQKYCNSLEAYLSDLDEQYHSCNPKL